MKSAQPRMSSQCPRPRPIPPPRCWRLSSRARYWRGGSRARAAAAALLPTSRLLLLLLEQQPGGEAASAASAAAREDARAAVHGAIHAAVRHFLRSDAAAPLQVWALRVVTHPQLQRCWIGRPLWRRELHAMLKRTARTFHLLREHLEWFTWRTVRTTPWLSVQRKRKRVHATADGPLPLDFADKWRYLTTHARQGIVNTLWALAACGARVPQSLVDSLQSARAEARSTKHRQHAVGSPPRTSAQERPARIGRRCPWGRPSRKSGPTGLRVSRLCPAPSRYQPRSTASPLRGSRRRNKCWACWGWRMPPRTRRRGQRRIGRRCPRGTETAAASSCALPLPLRGSGHIRCQSQVVPSAQVMVLPENVWVEQHLRPWRAEAGLHGGGGGNDCWKADKAASSARLGLVLCC